MSTEYRHKNLPPELEALLWEQVKLLQTPPENLLDETFYKNYLLEQELLTSELRIFAEKSSKNYVTCAVLKDNSVVPWYELHTITAPDDVLEMVMVFRNTHEVSLIAAIQRLEEIGVKLNAEQMFLVRTAQETEARNIIKPRLHTPNPKLKNHQHLAACHKENRVVKNALTSLSKLTAEELEAAILMLQGLKGSTDETI